MYDAERSVALICAGDDHSQAVDVDYLRERRAFSQHLFIDAVQVFFPRIDFGFDAGLGERDADVLGDLTEKLFLVAACAFDGFFDDSISPWIKGSKPKIFELQLHRIESEALG